MVRVAPKGMRVIDRTVEAVAHASGTALRAAGLSQTQLSSFLVLLKHIEEGWEAVIPADENPLARREGSGLETASRSTS